MAGGQGLGILALLLLSRVIASIVPGLAAQATAAVTLFTFTTRDYAYCLTGAVLIFAASRPGRRDWAAACAFGGLIGLLYLRLPPHPSSFSAAFALPALLGLGALIVAAARALALRRKDEVITALAMAAPVVYWFSKVSLLRHTPFTLPRTNDPLLYAFDSTFGGQVSFQLGQYFYAVPLLGAAAGRAYFALTLWLPALYALWRLRRGTHPLDLFGLCLGIGVVGLVLYHLFPAVGPAYQFGFSYPFDPPPVTAQLSSLPLSQPLAPRNAMPSLHFSWTLMLFWNTRGLGRLVRLAAGVILALTVLATLGFGEHYAVDLVVAVPFTMALETLIVRQEGASVSLRAGSFAFGAAMTAVWLLLLRYDIAVFLSHPLLSWVLMAFSTIASVWLEHWFATARVSQPVVVSAPVLQKAAA